MEGRSKKQEELGWANINRLIPYQVITICPPYRTIFVRWANINLMISVYDNSEKLIELDDYNYKFTFSLVVLI